MRIALRASGALKSGPERALVDDYIRRADGLARGVGFRGVEEQEVVLRGVHNKTDATRALLDGIGRGARIVLLDERGRSLASSEIASALSEYRDAGASELVLLIGPADGFDPALLPSAPRWAFGRQTWPHMLLRAMAAEQIYRALSILAGNPYHRA